MWPLKQKLKALQFTTYDLSAPNHGGKIRSFEIRKQLRKKFKVDTISFEWDTEESIESMSFNLDKQKWLKYGINGYTSDLGVSFYMEKELDTFNKLKTIVTSFSPDIILLEQPYLWPVVKQLIQEKELCDTKIKVVYSSHNIEHEMKRKIYNDFLDKTQADKLTEKVLEMEVDLIKSADQIIVATDSEKEFVRQHNKEVNIISLRNAHNKPTKNRRSKYWKDRLDNRKTNWVYIASAHPPNINGLNKVISDVENRRKEFDKLDLKLWLFGGVSQGLTDIYNIDFEKLPWIEVLGIAKEEDIDAAICECDGIILPIWEGGGSNLKTAQALLSNKYILASEYSFRGFEAYSNEYGVKTVKDVSSLVDLLLKIKPSKKYDRWKQVKGLSWKKSLEYLNTDII